MELHFTTHSERETLDLAGRFGQLLVPGDLIALDGELGAGKTRFVRGIARAMGIPDAAVSSPTYVIAQEYVPPPHCVASSSVATCPRLVHIDAYRLRGDDELDSIGWDELVRADPGTGLAPILVVEWAQRLGRSLSTFGERANVSLSHIGTPGHIKTGDDDGMGERRISIITPDSWRSRAGFAGLCELADGGGRSTGSEDAQWPCRQATRCPITGRVVPADSPTYPFFDEKARLADLNRWFTGGYTVSRGVTADDADDLTTDPGG